MTNKHDDLVWTRVLAKDDLTGNMAMENIIGYFRNHKEALNLDMEALKNSLEVAKNVFYTPH